MIIKAFLAGIAIAIGCVANLTVGGIGGAFLFSCGLLTVLYFGFNLYTGKAGLVVDENFKLIYLLEILFGNIFGTAVVAAIILGTKNNAVIEGCINIVEKRFTHGFFGTIFLSILCGILMYVAVTGYKKTKSPVIVILPVMVFVTCGFEHCIADAFYYIVAGRALGYVYLPITVIGNFIGCCTIPFLSLLSKIEDVKREKLKKLEISSKLNILL